MLCTVLVSAPVQLKIVVAAPLFRLGVRHQHPACTSKLVSHPPPDRGEHPPGDTLRSVSISMPSSARSLGVESPGERGGIAGTAGGSGAAV